MEKAKVNTTADAEKEAKSKQAKKEAAERFKERRKAEAVERVEQLKKLEATAKKVGLWDKLDADIQDFIIAQITPKASGNNTSGLFAQLFGAAPKVGDSITLMEAFNKTFKGLAPLQHYCKEWAKKGIIVEFKQEAKMQDSTFTIKALGDAAN